MARRISMATRKELIVAVGSRYRSSTHVHRRKILDEFVALTGYHRKHAIRVLSQPCNDVRPRQPRDRLYDEALRQVVLLLWEAADRICGKRLKALMPTLIESMERHGHLVLDGALKEKLASVSAATIDRLLAPARQQAYGQRKRRPGMGSAVRRNVPIRTFNDWNDPVPGYLEVDMVEHCGGPKQDGNFVHSLVLTDIASGWTECVALLVREQTLVVEGFVQARAQLPVAVRGLDTDNDSAFMNDTVFGYCQSNAIEFTRSRAYRKNDQAWVEQKNGAIVRRLVGYGRLSGGTGCAALAKLYASSRLYVNFFQPCFKLKSKERIGALVTKKYHPPRTPCERLLASKVIDESTKDKLRDQLARLDPVALLQSIRSAQQEIRTLSVSAAAKDLTHVPADVETFVRSLATAWRDGEVRPTHRKRSAARWWRTRMDPFEETWAKIARWLEREPSVTAKELMHRLTIMMPDVYPTARHLRTLQRRVSAWRRENAKQLIFGHATAEAPAQQDMPVMT